MQKERKKEENKKAKKFNWHKVNENIEFITPVIIDNIHHTEFLYFQIELYLLVQGRVNSYCCY